MKELSSSELKKIEFEMLKNVAEFCEASGIMYFLACGTALGAIRHNGFIPWDDDVDIAMPRPDYERFVNTYKSEMYEIIDSRFDEAYPYAFAKVSDKGTVLIENIAKPFPMGVYIDVFPIDGMPNNEEERQKHLNKIEWYTRLLSWKRISKTKKVGMIHKIFQLIAKALLSPVSIKTLVSWLDREVKRYTFENSEYVGHLTTKATWGNDTKPKYIFAQPIKHKFETAEFNLPVFFDEYLTLEYGNYMSLPPEEKRISLHDFTVRRKE